MSEPARLPAGDYNRQIETLVQNNPDGLCLLDEQHRLLIYNDAAAALLQLLLREDAAATTPAIQVGLRIETLAGEPLPAFLDGARHEVTVEDFDGAQRPLAGPSTGAPAERKLTIRARAVPVRDGEQKGTRGWVLVLRDITERHRLIELSRQQERLAAVGQLAAGIAHDFNNILSSILLYAQMLGNEPHLSDGGRRRLQVIQQQTTRASDLVRQILDFSRRSVMQRDDVDLVALCRQLVEELRRNFAANIEISLQQRADRYVVSGDASRLRQALLNLAINAREAMPQGGRLLFNLSHRHIRPDDTVPQLGMEPGLWLQLVVADTGAGIAPESLPHVFEPFFSTKPLHEGAGLGLPQAHGIVHQHGGHVKVESELGEGTVVTIFLPLQEKPAPLLESTAPVSGEYCVFVVEVNDDLRQALGDALRDAAPELGYRLYVTATSQEALAIIQRQGLQPDLLIGDLTMPHMSGLALLQAMRARNPACRMIIISSYPRPSNMAHYRAAGVSDWLPKPFSMSDLTQRIAQLLQG